MTEGADAVERYSRSKLVQDMNPTVAARATHLYRVATESMDEFMDRYRQVLDAKLPCPLYPRQRLQSFGRRVYGIRRRVPPELLLEEIAQDAAGRVLSGTGPDRLAKAARLALWAINGSGTDADEQWLEARIVAIRLEKESGGNMTDEQQQVVAEEAQPTVEDKNQAARAREEKVVVKVRLSDLRDQVEQYLGERLNSKEAAELAAQGLVELLEARSLRSRPRPEVPDAAGDAGNGQGNGSGNGRGNGKRSTLVWATEESVNDRFRSKRTVEALKQALAGHQMIVRLVVAERLQGLRTVDQIATKFDLTKEEVLDILGKMRFWVGRFTDSYRDDWYWCDSKQKYSIPEHKLAPRKKDRDAARAQAKAEEPKS